MAKRRKRKRPSSCSPVKKAKSQVKETVLCFQDVWKEHCSNRPVDGDGDETAIDLDTAISNVFFELANASSVSYRLEAPLKTKSTTMDANSKTIILPKESSSQRTIVIRQDVSGAAETHTGGIVWETSYLLLNYLLACKDWRKAFSGPDDKNSTCLEVGAGCGMLGLCLHKAFELGILEEKEYSGATSRVIVTETNEVMDNLRKNFQRNYPLLSSNETDTDKSGIHQLSVEELDWTRYQEDCDKANIEAGSIDCIVGTDVVFSTRFVRPMLETMRYLSHSNSVVYLCLQERCRDAHELLLQKAEEYGFRIDDISETVYSDETLSESCEFGRALDCKLLKFTVLATHVDRKEKPKVKIEKKSKKKTKKKSKKEKRK